jgi:hypothetical protein
MVQLISYRGFVFCLKIVGVNEYANHVVHEFEKLQLGFVEVLFVQCNHLGQGEVRRSVPVVVDRTSKTLCYLSRNTTGHSRISLNLTRLLECGFVSTERKDLINLLCETRLIFLPGPHCSMDTKLCAADIDDPYFLCLRRCDAKDLVFVFGLVSGVAMTVPVVDNTGDHLVDMWFENYADFLDLNVQTYNGLVVCLAMSSVDLTFRKLPNDAIHRSCGLAANHRTEHSVLG